MKQTICLLILATTIVVASDPDWQCKRQKETTQDSFDLLGAGSFTATGGHNSRLVYPVRQNVGSLNPAKIILNVEQSELFFNHTVNVHWFYPNGSYFYVPNFNECFYRPEITFYNQVDYFKDLTLVNEELVLKSCRPIRAYAGAIHDQHACPEIRTGTYVEANDDGALIRWHWSAPLPVGPKPQIVQDASFDEIIYEAEVMPALLDLCITRPANFTAFFGCKPTTCFVN